MRKSWIILAILPAVAFCIEESGELFYIADQSDEILLNIACAEFEENLADSVGAIEAESQGLSLLEIDEDDELLLPWCTEVLADEGMPGFLEETARELAEEFEDAFVSETPEKMKEYKPSPEKVMEHKQAVAGRPKVVQSKPINKVKKEKKLAKKTASSDE